MSVYVVTWNLNKERSGYDQARRDFLTNLGRFDNVEEAALDSVRWVSTTNNPSQISEVLRQKMDANDRLFISKLSSGHHAGWLTQATWDWINARL